MNDLNLPFSAIKILSQSEAEELTSRNPEHWNVVSIYSGGGGKHGGEIPNLKYAKSVHQERFHDIDKPTKHHDGYDLILCNKKQIKSFLDFAKSKYNEPILVHCHAGISRSSAICFLILLDYFKDKSDMPIEDSLHYLTAIKSHHLIYPNRHILNLGIELIAESMDDGYYSQMKWMRELHNSSIFNKIYGRAFIQDTSRENLKFSKTYKN